MKSWCKWSWLGPAGTDNAEYDSWQITDQLWCNCPLSADVSTGTTGVHYLHQPNTHAHALISRLTYHSVFSPSVTVNSNDTLKWSFYSRWSKSLVPKTKKDAHIVIWDGPQSLDRQREIDFLRKRNCIKVWRRCGYWHNSEFPSLPKHRYLCPCGKCFYQHLKL